MKIFQIFFYTFICENFTVKFYLLLNESYFLNVLFFHFPLNHIETMNDINRKNFRSSGSDECNELYTVKTLREKTRSDAISRVFCGSHFVILFLYKFCIYTPIYE